MFQRGGECDREDCVQDYNRPQHYAAKRRCEPDPREKDRRRNVEDEQASDSTSVNSGNV